MASSSNHHFDFKYVGQCRYQESLQIQETCLAEAQSKKKIIGLGFEYPATVTFGRRYQDSLQLKSTVAETERLEKLGFEVNSSPRGGLATIHSPGQLVVYPVVPAEIFSLGVKKYVACLLECSQEALQFYGVKSTVDDEKGGVFTDGGKIVFCGVQVKQRVYTHGVSLNLSNDLKLFSSIVPCGVQGQSLDSLENYVAHFSRKKNNSVKLPTSEEFFRVWGEKFKNKINHWTCQQNRQQDAST